MRNVSHEGHEVTKLILRTDQNLLRALRGYVVLYRSRATRLLER